MMGFLKGTIQDILRLEANNEMQLKLFIEAAFAVHYDLKSHTGSAFTLGKGSISSNSTKQKVNSRSLIEAELVGLDDKIAK
eukprot:4796051-Ditylum_brightwellii.AAC.1